MEFFKAESQQSHFRWVHNSRVLLWSVLVCSQFIVSRRVLAVLLWSAVCWEMSGLGWACSLNERAILQSIKEKLFLYIFKTHSSWELVRLQCRFYSTRQDINVFAAFPWANYRSHHESNKESELKQKFKTGTGAATLDNFFFHSLNAH